MRKFIVEILNLLLFTAFIFVFEHCRNSGAKHYSNSIDKDTLEYSFVTVGCNRIDKADFNYDNPATANTEQLKKTFEEVAALKPSPDFFFFTGDMVFGYAKSDTMKLDSELLNWRKIYEASSLYKTRTKLVTIPGNHELLYSKESGAGNLPAEQAWLRVMDPYIRGANGPKPGTNDSLITDESRLSYSFDYKGAHFIVLNTDEVGHEGETNNFWISDDIKNANLSGQKNIFVFSHIPAYAPPGMNGKGEQIGHPDQFWKILNDNKVTAMFSAHNHVYFRHRPVQGKTWMVIAGNGGSKLNKNVTEEQKFYGYTLVRVYKSGRIILESMGRPLPAGGYNAAAIGTITTVRDSADISWE